MRHDRTAFRFTGSATGLFVAGFFATGLFAVLCAAPLMALPPDPQRPFVAQDCPAALARLAEAEAGNPLISAPEMAEVVLSARAQAQRLCATYQTDPSQTHPVETRLPPPHDLTHPAKN